MGVTVKEKRKALQRHCDRVNDCKKCLLEKRAPVFHGCYNDSLTDTVIEENYEIVFGPDTPPVNTCVSCGAEIPEGRQVCPDCEIGDGCDNCAFALKEPDEEPCNKCKNNILVSDPRYESAPLNWKPEGYIEPDPIKPKYYNDTKITPFDVIDDWGLNFYLGNAVKYIKRAGKKADNSRLQDLKKIREYIDHEIRAEEVN